MFNIGDKVRVKDEVAYEAGYEGTVIEHNPSNGDDVRILIEKGARCAGTRLTYNNEHLELITTPEDPMVEALNRHTEAMLRLVEALDEHSHQMSVFEN